MTLLIDGSPCDLRLRCARSGWARLVGFWPAPHHHGVEVMHFDRCRAIHTWAMRAALDIVFVDEQGRVLRVIRCLRPWRGALEVRAHAVFEFRAGLAEDLGIEPGTRLHLATHGDGPTPPAPLAPAALAPAARASSVTRPATRRERGASMVEFVLAATLVLLPMVSGILEFAQLAVSRQLLAQATLDAARSASINVMDAGGETDNAAEALAIRLSLARGLLPLFGGAELEAARLAELTLETLRPDRLQVAIERDLVAAVDVVVDRVEVVYCRELFFVPASYFLPALMRLWTVDPFERLCLESGRVPLRASAPATRSRYP